MMFSASGLYGSYSENIEDITDQTAQICNFLIFLDAILMQINEMFITVLQILILNDLKKQVILYISNICLLWL